MITSIQRWDLLYSTCSIITTYLKRHTSMKICFSSDFFCVSHTYIHILCPKSWKPEFSAKKFNLAEIINVEIINVVIFPHLLIVLQKSFLHGLIVLYSKIVSALTHCTPNHFSVYSLYSKSHFCMDTLYSKIISALTDSTPKPLANFLLVL